MKRFFSYDDQNDFELRDTLAEAERLERIAEQERREAA